MFGKFSCFLLIIFASTIALNSGKPTYLNLARLVTRNVRSDGFLCQ